MYSAEGYQSLRHGSAIVRRGDRGVLTVTGGDRLDWLQGLLTNDVASLKPGDSRYAAYLTPQGRMIADMRVVHRADRTLLEVPGVLAGGLKAKLDALLFAEEAQIDDSSTDIAVVDVHGPHAPAVATSAPVSIRDDVYGVPGITFFVPRRETDALTRALTTLGARETSLETLEVLRIEAGRPLFLVDMDEHTIPLEAGIEDRAISFTKGCYVGQEVIVRVMHRGGGRVAKKLVGFLFEKNAIPRPGDAVRADDREIGRVTSAVWSPALERPIALGYAHRDFLEPGRTTQVVTSEGTVPASIATLPFVTPATS